MIRQLSGALPTDVEVIGAGTWDDAVQRLSEVSPHLIVVCYVFDEMRPYRFIQHVRDTESRRVPIFLIRAVSLTATYSPGTTIATSIPEEGKAASRLG